MVPSVDWPRKIREAVANGAENKVYIRADIRAKYAWVAEVLNEVRSSGVEDVAFLVAERRASRPPE